MERAAQQPTVWISEDVLFHRVWLSQIVEDAGCALVKGDGSADAAYHGAPDLIVCSMTSTDALTTLREVRAIPAFQRAPILGLTTLDRSGLPIEQLKALGVVGLIDKRAIPELVSHRINEITRDDGGRRRFRRAPTFLCVDVTHAGRVSTEYALNLSAGGMLLTAGIPLDANDELALRFQLPLVSPEWLDLRARVIYRRRGRNSAGLYEVGLFFLDPSDVARRLLEAEVDRLLEQDDARGFGPSR